MNISFLAPNNKGCNKVIQTFKLEILDKLCNLLYKEVRCKELQVIRFSNRRRVDKDTTRIHHTPIAYLSVLRWVAFPHRSDGCLLRVAVISSEYRVLWPVVQLALATPFHTTRWEHQ